MCVAPGPANAEQADGDAAGANRQPPTVNRDAWEFSMSRIDVSAVHAGVGAGDAEPFDAAGAGRTRKRPVDAGRLARLGVNP